MIAQRRPGHGFGHGPVSEDRGAGAWVWLGRCLVVGAAVLLLAAVNLALYAANGGVDVPAEQPYRWDGAGPVHVAVRSGAASCAHSANGGPRGFAVAGYDLVLGSVMHGRSITGRPHAGSPNILICDRPVTVTTGWVLRAYPLAGSWARFIGYLAVLLVGVFLAAPGRPRRPRRNPATTAPVIQRRGRERAGAQPTPTPTGAKMATRPAIVTTNQNYAAATQPSWARTNVKVARIRADAEEVRPMRFGRTNRWGHRLIQDTAMGLAGVAGLAVMPLLLVLFGDLPPRYVTYPLVAAVIIGCYLLLSRKLYDYKLGPRWQPKPRRPPKQGSQPEQGSQPKRGSQPEQGA